MPEGIRHSDVASARIQHGFDVCPTWIRHGLSMHSTWIRHTITEVVEVIVFCYFLPVNVELMSNSCRIDETCTLLRRECQSKHPQESMSTSRALYNNHSNSAVPAGTASGAALRQCGQICRMRGLGARRLVRAPERFRRQLPGKEYLARPLSSNGKRKPRGKAAKLSLDHQLKRGDQPTVRPATVEYAIVVVRSTLMLPLWMLQRM